MPTGASMSASGGDVQSRSEADKRNQPNALQEAVHTNHHAVNQKPNALQEAVLRMFSNTSVSAKHVWHNMLPGGKSEVQKP